MLKFVVLLWQNIKKWRVDILLDKSLLLEIRVDLVIFMDWLFFYFDFKEHWHLHPKGQFILDPGSFFFFHRSSTQ